MQNDFLETQIIIEDGNYQLEVGEIRKGEIIIRPKENLDIYQFGFELIMEGRGRTSVITKVASKKKLLGKKTLLKGEEYQFDIEIIGALPGSYYGKNIKFNWKVKTYIALQNSSYQELRKELIKGFKLQSAFNPDKFLSEEFDLTINQSSQPFTVINKPQPLKSSGCFHWVIFILGTFIPFLILHKQNHPSTFLIAGCISFTIFILFILPHYYKKSVIGQIDFNVENMEDDSFLMSFNFTKNNKRIKKVDVHYLVVEKVIDNRGTSSTTHKHTIYKSENQQKKHPSKTEDFIFKFPEKNIPPTFYSRNIKFYWEAKIKIQLDIGLTSNFSHIIETNIKDI